jgi:hypothetical protein
MRHINDRVLKKTVKRVFVGIPKQEAKLHRSLVTALQRSPVKSGDKRIICSELDVWHGIPDVVVATTNGNMGWAELLVPCHLKRLNLTTAKLLSQLRLGSYKSLSEISKSIGFSSRTLSEHLQVLETAGLVRCKGSSARLLRPTKSPFFDVAAFEVKVSDWRHALYQATHYRAFAHRSSVALPDAKARSVAIHKETFRRFGIGLLGIKAPSTINWYVKPVRRLPFSTSRILLSSVQILKRRESRVLRGFENY